MNALAKNYNKKVAGFSGPMYKLMKIEGQKIRLSFDYTNGGLVAREGQLSEFVIAGEDKVFVPAQAVIEGDTVVVWSDQVTRRLPCGMRGPTGLPARWETKRACQRRLSVRMTGSKNRIMYFVQVV